MAKFNAYINLFKSFDKQLDQNSQLEVEVSRHRELSACKPVISNDSVCDKLAQLIQHDAYLQSVIDKENAIRLNIYQQMMVNEDESLQLSPTESPTLLRIRPETYLKLSQLIRIMDQTTGADIEVGQSDLTFSSQAVSKLSSGFVKELLKIIAETNVMVQNLNQFYESR